jgi:PAS domain S-box-containing protein
MEINSDDQFVFFEDITTARQAGEKLKKSEERFRQVIENAEEAILVIQDGWVKFCNPKSVEISGYSVEEQRGRPFTEFMHPDHRNPVMKNYTRRMAGKPSPERDEITFIHKNGRPRFFLLNTKLITWDNRPASLVFETDMTENKMAKRPCVKARDATVLFSRLRRKGLLLPRKMDRFRPSTRPAENFSD